MSADSSPLRDTSSVATNYHTEILHIYDAVLIKRLDTAVPCHRTRYDKHTYASNLNTMKKKNFEENKPQLDNAW